MMNHFFKKQEIFLTFGLTVSLLTILFLILTGNVANGQTVGSQLPSLLNHIEGYAAKAGTTGGEGYPVYTVTSAANSGAGTLRDALSQGQRYIVFDSALDGQSIQLSSDIGVKGNEITLDGRGANVTIKGGTIKFEGTNYVLAFLTFSDNTNVGGSDSVTFRLPTNATADQHFFVYKCTFNHASDGLLDIIWNRGFNVYGTVKLSTFSNHDKAILIGTNDMSKEGGRYYISFTQNHFYQLLQRIPLTRRGEIHFYNNLVEKWGKDNGAGGGAFAGDDSVYLAENNIAIPYAVGDPYYFGLLPVQPHTTTVSSPLLKVIAPHFTAQNAKVRATGNRLVDGAYVNQVDDGAVADPPYAYLLHDAETEILQVSHLETYIRANSGDGAAVEQVLLSSNSDGRIGDLQYKDEDIVLYDARSGLGFIFLDGSAIGLDASSGLDIDAFHVMPDLTIFFSVVGDGNLPGLGPVDDSDIIRFEPDTLGETTAGSLSIYFDGSDVGLSGGSEDIDALFVDHDGNLIVSTAGSYNLGGGTTGRDEDLIIFTPTSLGTATAGSWAQYLDGSDIGLASTNDEDIFGTWIEDDDIYLTMRGDFNASGVVGQRADIMRCEGGTTGSASACGAASLYWDGDAFGFGSERLDGIQIFR